MKAVTSKSLQKCEVIDFPDVVGSRYNDVMTLDLIKQGGGGFPNVPLEWTLQ